MPTAPVDVRSVTYKCPRCEARLRLCAPRFRVYLTPSGVSAQPRACCYSCGQVVLLKRGKFVKHGSVDHRHLLGVPKIMLAYHPTPGSPERPLEPERPGEDPEPADDEYEEPPHPDLDKVELDFLFGKQ